MGDPYVRLRAAPPTPEEEYCACPGKPPVLLMDALGPNPLHCLRCNGEVEPSRLPLPEELADGVAHWASVYGAIHTLEIDSGPYEAWARGELIDLQSPVNVEALALCRQLGKLRPW